jgi:hypothetical protein
LLKAAIKEEKQARSLTKGQKTLQHYAKIQRKEISQQTASTIH